MGEEIVKRIIPCGVLINLFLCYSLVSAGEVKIEPGNKTGVYKVGDEASWTIDIKDDAGPANGEATYTIKAGGYGKNRKVKSEKGGIINETTSKPVYRNILLRYQI